MDYRQIAAELERLDAEGPITIRVTASEAWAVLSNLHIAFRCAGNTGPARLVAEQVAQRIQATAAPQGSALAALAERGWPSAGEPRPPSDAGPVAANPAGHPQKPR
jgi:hypothetical protein